MGELPEGPSLLRLTPKRARWTVPKVDDAGSWLLLSRHPWGMRWAGFTDRRQAGEILGDLMRALNLTQPVVLALPRGGVPVGAEVARTLGADLDVIVVRKMGPPHQPELALGTLSEEGVCMWNTDVLDWSGLDSQELSVIRDRETAILNQRVNDYRRRVPEQNIDGKIAVIVDDGVATGSGALAACEVARLRGAVRVVVAVPVAPVGWESRFRSVADECVAVRTPEPFRSVGSFYEDFHQVDDREVLEVLTAFHPGLAQEPGEP
jgi:putative phosphoribosyl transferase